MPLPSYARPTASSTLKSNPQSLKPKDTKSTLTPPRRLKRPSTLIPSHRHAISSHSSLLPITPEDPTKPCPISLLPTELRSIIYTHILTTPSELTLPHILTSYRPWRQLYIPPSILHVSRAIRLEAAYVYYASTRLTFEVRMFNFTAIQKWIETLPAQHRSFLARNRRLVLQLTPRGKTVEFEPRVVLGEPIERHWKDCARFGNLYEAASYEGREKFVFFCRLVGWFRVCADVGVRWRYVVDRRAADQDQDQWWGQWWSQCYRKEDYFAFLKQAVTVLGSARVQRLWTREKGGEGKGEALAYLECMDEVFGEFSGKFHPSWREEWKKEMRRARRVVERW